MPEQNKIDVAEPDRGADSGRGGQLLLYLLAEELEYTSDYPSGRCWLWRI